MLNFRISSSIKRQFFEKNVVCFLPIFPFRQVFTIKGPLILKCRSVWRSVLTETWSQPMIAASLRSCSGNVRKILKKTSLTDYSFLQKLHSVGNILENLRKQLFFQHTSGPLDNGPLDR